MDNYYDEALEKAYYWDEDYNGVNPGNESWVPKATTDFAVRGPYKEHRIPGINSKLVRGYDDDHQAARNKDASFHISRPPVKPKTRHSLGGWSGFKRYIEQCQKTEKKFGL